MHPWQLAEEIGREIWQRRVPVSDGSVTWFRPGSFVRGEPPGLRVRVDPFLYDGAAGIALFFAALARLTGRPEQRDRSLQALAPVRRKVAEIVADLQRAARLRRLDLGAMTGIGSLAYSFLAIGELVGEPALVTEALDVLTLMTPLRIEQDETCDVYSGAAGAILVLLALHDSAHVRALAGNRCLELACSCASHLLARQSAGGGCRHRTWRTLPGQPPLAGFSHGAAGICYALLRLFKLTDERRLLCAASEGLAFENSLYSPERRNWRDLRLTDAPAAEPGWCVGAAGIALARLAALDVLDTVEVRGDIENGLATARSAPPGEFDHICCGNMGRVDVLLRAHQATDDALLLLAAQGLAAKVLARSTFRCRPAPAAGAFDPTLFTGLAGIGYVLLRLENPSALPCVLLLDPPRRRSVADPGVR
jgi:lantibiotic modifying enzyme